MVANPMEITASGNLTGPQMDKAMMMNGATTGLNFLTEVGDKIANYSLMSKMFSLQTEQMGAYYGLQGKLVDLNGSLISSQEKIAIKQLNTTEKIAELQKDRDVAVAKTKADAAVKIAKVNALNAQFYGKPVNNQLPSISA